MMQDLQETCSLRNRSWRCSIYPPIAPPITTLRWPNPIPSVKLHRYSHGYIQLIFELKPMHPAPNSSLVQQVLVAPEPTTRMRLQRMLQLTADLPGAGGKGGPQWWRSITAKANDKHRLLQLSMEPFLHPLSTLLNKTELDNPLDLP